LGYATSTCSGIIFKGKPPPYFGGKFHGDEKMNGITLSTDLLNAIMQYLGTRPYVEIAGLINEVQKQAQAQVAQPAQAPQAPAETPAEAPAQ